MGTRATAEGAASQVRSESEGPSSRAWRWAFSFLFGALAACSPGPRDVVTESRDVRQGPDEAAAATANGGYTYVAKRAHGAIGLVGVKRLHEPDARKLVDALADELEACARRQDAQGRLVKGAASFVMFGGARGNADVSDVQLAPGGPVAANALECLIAPARAQTLPAPTDAGVSALAVDASWGPSGP